MSCDLVTLPGGLRVVTVPMRDRDSAGVAIWVKTGSRYESAALNGAAHFLEHLLFKGTRKRTARQIKLEIEGVGGMLNAFTGEESTCYYAKLLAGHFPRALEVLADMVKNAVLDAKELEKERTVILEEIRMYRDLPSQHVHDMMSELLWPDHPLGRPISGTETSVSRLTRSQIIHYKKRFYQPRNIVVTVSGHVEAREVVRLAGDLLGGSGTGAALKFDRAESRQRKPASVFLEKTAEQTQLVIALRAMSRFHPDRYKLALLNILLGSNMSSRLFEEVREKRGLAYEIRSGVSYFHDTGALSISAGVDKAKAGRAIGVILRELEKLRQGLIPESELRRAKDYFLSQLSMALEDTLDHLLWAGERVLDGGDLPDRARIRKNVEAVTVADIRRVARNVFCNENLNLALIGPLGEAAQRGIAKDFELNER